MRSRFGNEAWLQVYGDLKPASREIFSRHLLPSAWYPYFAYAEVLDIVVRRFYGGKIESAREVGANDLEASLNSVYRMLYKAGSPAFIIRMSSLLWRAYFNTGRMVVEESGRGFARVRIEAFTPPAKAVCWDIFGSLCRGLELSGATAIHAAHTDCPLKGDAAMRYEATWTEKGQAGAFPPSPDPK
ncbi:MAG: hypothetical protein ACE5FC_06935 [Myxococcota bacterium]